MPTTKPARASNVKPAKRFSLVPAAAQQEMYRALTTLKSSRARAASGSEVAEIAVCLAAGEPCPVILACAARGARAVRNDSKLAGVKGGDKNRRLAAATLAAIDALLNAALLDDPHAIPTVICAGQ